MTGKNNRSEFVTSRMTNSDRLSVDEYADIIGPIYHLYSQFLQQEILYIQISTDQTIQTSSNANFLKLPII